MSVDADSAAAVAVHVFHAARDPAVLAVLTAGVAKPCGDDPQTNETPSETPPRHGDASEERGQRRVLTPRGTLLLVGGPREVAANPPPLPIVIASEMEYRHSL